MLSLFLAAIAFVGILRSVAVLTVRLDTAFPPHFTLSFMDSVLM